MLISSVLIASDNASFLRSCRYFNVIFLIALLLFDMMGFSHPEKKCRLEIDERNILVCEPRLKE